MDPRLLRLYSDELAHLREVGAEFAQEFPKIASRLGMEGMEVTDPYVERLLEGFAFLTARVQLKLESEHPRLIAHLLEATYPNFLAPVPSMLIARFGVDPADPNLVKGYVVPRGSVVVSELARRTRPWFVQQGIDPTRNEAIAPESHRKSGGLQVASHRRIISPRGASQNDSGAESHGAARAGLTRNPLQFFTLGVTHDQISLFGTASWVGHDLLDYGLLNNTSYL